MLSRLLLQLLAASTSMGSNLEEAAEGQSRADFIAKMCIVRKEARESRFWLRLIVTTFPAHQSELAPLIQESSEIRAIVSAIIRNTRNNAAPVEPDRTWKSMRQLTADPRTLVDDREPSDH